MKFDDKEFERMFKKDLNNALSISIQSIEHIYNSVFQVFDFGKILKDKELEVGTKTFNEWFGKIKSGKYLREDQLDDKSLDEYDKEQEEIRKESKDNCAHTMIDFYKSNYIEVFAFVYLLRKDLEKCFNLRF